MAIAFSPGRLFAYPELPNVPRPASEWALPAGVDVYTPPLDDRPVPSDAPAMAEWTRTAGPSDIIVATGEGLQRSIPARGRADDLVFIVYGQTSHANGTLRRGRIEAFEERMVAVSLSEELPTDSMYLVWPKNKAGYGRPIAINRTEASWLGPDVVTRGQVAAVHGRNLSHKHGRRRAWVRVVPSAGGRGRWLSVVSVNPHRVTFKVPDDLPNGRYEIWTHNGHGGHYGWSGPLILIVDDGVQWRGQTFNVVDFGAIPDDGVDDSAAIELALRAAVAASPGTTIHFPAGTYYTKKGFYLPSNVRWRGDGRQSVVALRGFDHVGGASGSALLYDEEVIDRTGRVLRPGQQNIEIRDLTLDANNALGSAPYLIFLRGTKRLAFVNVAIKARGYNPLDLHRSEYVEMSHTDIIGKTTFLGSGRQLFIDHVNYYGTNDSGTLWYSWGRSQLSMTDSTARNFNQAAEDGWCQGRFYTNSGNWTSSRDVYLGENRSYDLGVRSGFGVPGSEERNTGEQLLWEQNFTLFRGSPAQVTESTLTFPGLTIDATGEEAIVVRGKGLAQHREIVSFEETTGTIRVAPEWRVMPDGGSDIILARAAARQNVYRNNLDAHDDAATELAHNASAGVELYGGCYDFAVTHNTFNQIRHGASVWAVEPPKERDVRELQPSFFNLYAQNSFFNTRIGFAVYLGVSGFDHDPGIGLLGITFRRNVVRAAIDGAVILSGGALASGRPFEMNVVEHNRVVDVRRGLDIASTTAASGEPLVGTTIVYDNSFVRGRVARSGSRAITSGVNSKAVFRRNASRNFEVTYDGTARH